MFLQGIRDKASNWFSWVLLIVVGIPFALWGINSYFTGTGKVSVASVNGEAISAQVFRRASLQEENRLRKQLGADYQGEMLDDPAIKRALLDRLINEQVLQQTAKSYRLRFSPQQTAELITQNSVFQTDGKFDKDVYQVLLRQQETSPANFEKQLQQSALADQLQAGVAGSGFATPAELLLFKELQLQRRDIRYAMIEKSRFIESQSVTTEEMSEYYEKHLPRFHTAEMVSVQYITLQLDDIAQDIEVSPEDVQALYNERLEELTVPEQRRASHILIKLDEKAGEAEQQAALEKAQGLVRQLEQGKSFSELARSSSEDIGATSTGGDLGLIQKGVLDPAVEAAVFSLALNQVSELVRSKFGYHLIKVTEISAEKSPSLETLQDELRLEIKKQRAESAFYAKAELLQNLVFEHPDSLSPAAEQTNLEIKTSEPFSREGGSGIAALQDFVQQAFAPAVLYEDANSEVFELPGEILVALRRREHIPAKPKPLAEVETEIRAILQSEKAATLAKSLGETLQQELASGADLPGLTEKHKIDWQERKGIARDREEKNVPPLVIQETFKLKLPEQGGSAYGGMALPSGDYLLYAVDNITQASADWTEEDRLLAQRDIARLRGASAFVAYLSGLKAEAAIEVFEQNL